MKERFLPIGTVVLLKGGKKYVMVTSYCIFPNKVQIKEGKPIQPEKKMYEYGGCVYPEGIIDTSMSCAFNHNQIDKIIYMGYESEDQKKLSQILNSGYDNYKKVYETEGIEGIKKMSQEQYEKKNSDSNETH